MEIKFIYGIEDEQFKFYSVPKLLMDHPVFGDISIEAKYLYARMLDRVSLSRENNWKEEGTGRIYIIYTIEQIMTDLHCANQKATKLVKELEKACGCGLIERKRQGLGKPTLIFVKNFASAIDVQDDNDYNVLNHENHDSENEESHVLNHENHESEENQSKSLVQTYENHDSGVMNNMIADSWNSHGINTNNIKTEIINTKSINQSIVEDSVEKTEPYVRESERKQKEYEQLRLKVSGQIGLVDLLLNGRNDAERQHIMEIYELIVEVLDEVQATLRVGKVERPIQQVQERFAKLTHEHVEYVLDCLTHDNDGNIYNIRNYLITSLYNSITSIGSYYASKVNYTKYYGTFYKGE